MSRSDRSDRSDHNHAHAHNHNKKYQTLGKWLDAKCDNCSSVTDEPNNNDDDGYSYAYSSYMADLGTDTIILPGSNRSNAFYLTSQILGYLDSSNTVFSIPYASPDRRFVRFSANSQNIQYREFGFGISEQSLYYFIYTCSTKYVKRYAPYADEYTPYAQRQLRLSYTDTWSDVAGRDRISGTRDIVDYGSASEYQDENIDLEDFHTYYTEDSYVLRSESTDTITISRNFDTMLNHLHSEMSRLLDCAREVHNAIIAPFINSSDCSWNVMRYVSDQDDWVFIEFVKSSSTYRIMLYLVCVLENHKKNVRAHNYA